MKNGYPPKHIDADGDFKKKEKVYQLLHLQLTHQLSLQFLMITVMIKFLSDNVSHL